MNPKELMENAVQILDKKKGMQIVALKIDALTTVADYFGDMSNLEKPYHVWYDYFDPPYVKIDFQATKFYSYLDGAPVAAKGYIDDDHYWTKTSAGDLCMFCQVADLKILSD